MGYAVYEQRVAGVTRWAGYGVPAECDWTGCTEQIDRGLAYRCETHTTYTEVDDVEVENEVEGCERTFCEEHLHQVEEHLAHEPKGESPKWMRHILRDESWATWRETNPDKVAEYAQATG